MINEIEKNKKRQALELLKIHYGYTSLRPGQEEVIDHLLAGRSAVVIMPTGGGKSLCYQLPALVLDGLTVVISPLIALMKDQVDGLNRIGIPAAFINSAISPAEAAARLEDAKSGRLKLLYIAPERFYNADFVRGLQNIKVALFAVDEAHCISQWGHDFRPSYTKMKAAIELLGRPTVAALTATATPEVRADIIKQLGLADPAVVITGFARPNLQFGVVQASSARKMAMIIDTVSNFEDGAGIIYAGTRARADELLSALLERNVEAAAYHAGMDVSERQWVQDGFMSGKVKVIVATNAFGLGIDKRDIRFVIHYDMPGTIEAYYQEAGRAGRDGKQSFCLLFYSSRDRYLQEFFIKGDNPPPELILEVYENLKNYGLDRVLVTYSELSNNLSDDVPEMAIGTAVKILEKEGLISRSHEKTSQAYLKIAAALEKILEALGSRAKKSEELVREIFRRWENELHAGWEINLEEAASIISSKKDSLLRLIKKLAEKGLAEYRPPFRGTEINILKRLESHEINIDFSALKEKRRNAYDKLDEMEGYIYHFGCRQSFILNYFGDKQTGNCGKCDNCLTGQGYARKTEAPNKLENRDALKRKEHGRYPTGRTCRPAPTAASSLDEVEITGDFDAKTTQLKTFDLYQEGLSLDEIAQRRNLKPGTIVEHLSYLIEKGLAVDINRFVSQKKQAEIKKAAEKSGAGTLSAIKERLGEDISWDDLRLTLAKRKT